MRADLAARLGQIRWNLHPLWGLAPRVDHKNDGLVESNLLSLSYGQVVRKDINEIGGLRPDSYETYNIIAPGDTVLRMTDLQNDQRSIRTGLATERVIITSAYITVRPDGDKVEPRFLHSVLRAYDIKKTFYEMGVGVRQTLKYAELADLPIPLPPRDTQRAIADYLDRETGEIDAMLAALDELTETLRLRRVQVIQSAVRSSRSIGIGLMLDVKLGKMLQTKPKSPTDRLQPYLRAAHIQPGGRLDLAIDTKEMYFSEYEAEALSLRAGDAVIVEGGAGFGRAACLTEDMPGWGFQNSIIRLRGASADTRYVVYALQAALESGEIAMACNAATFAHFTAEKVEGFRIPYHGTDQHRRIADHLDEVTGKIDAMLATIDELKALLVERRAALITDVVTGRKKIPA